MNYYHKRLAVRKEICPLMYLQILLINAKTEFSHRVHLGLSHLCKYKFKYTEFKIIPYGDPSFN